MFDAIGMQAFAQRTRRELLATGERFGLSVDGIAGLATWNALIVNEE
jgi:peptidoglycan hydrolase-like protein with peptidoglycan-binding domain